MGYVKFEDIFHPLDFAGFNIKNMKFKLVENIDPNKSNIFYDFKVLDVKMEEEKDRKLMLGIIEFSVKVEYNGEDVIEITIEGGFILASEIKEEVFIELLRSAGAPVLYDIIRYKIYELSTTNQFQDEFLLPLIDFDSFFKKLEE